jgi:hypothetical protein
VQSLYRTPRRVLVKPLHQHNGEGVIRGPKARDNGFGAGEEEGAFKAGDSLFAEKFTGARFAPKRCREAGVFLRRGFVYLWRSLRRPP